MVTRPSFLFKEFTITLIKCANNTDYKLSFILAASEKEFSYIFSPYQIASNGIILILLMFLLKRFYLNLSIYFYFLFGEDLSVA